MSNKIYRRDDNLKKEKKEIPKLSVVVKTPLSEEQKKKTIELITQMLQKNFYS